MIHDEKPTMDDILHFGVKGMHWGVTRTPEQIRKRELAKVIRKQSKYDTNKAIDGYGLIGYELQKMHKRNLRKNPNFEYRKLSREAKDAYQKKAAKKSARRIIRRGAIEIGVILAGGNLALNRVQASSDTIFEARVGVAGLAAQAGYIRVSELRSLHAAKLMDQTVAERRRLEGRSP